MGLLGALIPKSGAQMNRLDLYYTCSDCGDKIDNVYDLGFIPARGVSVLKLEERCRSCDKRYEIRLQIQTIDRGQPY
jgi:hypothetical protein